MALSVGLLRLGVTKHRALMQFGLSSRFGPGGRLNCRDDREYINHTRRVRFGLPSGGFIKYPAPADPMAKSSPHKPPAAKPAEPPEVEDLQPVALGRSSDEELMRRTQQGDRQAYSLLYERYSASVLSYLYRMLGNVEDVESIGQEVFLRAFRFAATYRYPQKFSTWLFTITRNLAINNARRKKRSPVRNITELHLEGVDLSSDPYQVAAMATDDVEKQEQIAQVLSALDGLPEDQKEVIVMGVFQDMSYAQMEEITGTKAVTLRSRMFHGLKRLGKLIGGQPGAE